MKFQTAALKFLVASKALHFGVRAQSIVVDRTSDTNVADAAVSDVLLERDSGGRFFPTGINNLRVVDSVTRGDGSISKTGTMHDTVADAAVSDVLLERDSGGRFFPSDINNLRFVDSGTRYDGSSSKTGTMHHTVADAAVSDVLVETLPADSTVADGWLLPTATFAAEVGSSLRFPRKLAKISTKDVIRQAKRKTKEAKKTTNPLKPPSSESVVLKPSGACVDDPGTIRHNGVMKEACRPGRETDTMLGVDPFEWPEMPYELTWGYAETMAVNAAIPEELAVVYAGEAFPQLSAVAWSSFVAGPDLAAGEAVGVALGGPVVWAIAGVIAVALVAVAVLAVLAEAFLGGIVDKDARCFGPDGVKGSCDGKIAFGSKARWTEKGTGNVHLCEPKCDNGCNHECGVTFTARKY